MLGEATLVDGSVEDQAVYKYKIPSKVVGWSFLTSRDGLVQMGF